MLCWSNPTFGGSRCGTQIRPYKTLNHPHRRGNFENMRVFHGLGPRDILAPQIVVIYVIVLVVVSCVHLVDELLVNLVIKVLCSLCHITSQSFSERLLLRVPCILLHLSCLPSSDAIALYRLLYACVCHPCGLVL